MLMFKVVVPVTAVLLYVPVFFGHIVLSAIGAVVVVIVGVVACCWGLAVSYRRPRQAAFAIGGWTVACVIVLAAVCVGAAWAGVRIKDAGPATASASVKTFAAIGAAALAAVLAALLDECPMLTGGGIAKWRLATQFKAKFPSQPKAPQEGIEAWRAVSYAFVTAQPKEWDRKFRSTLFQTVKAGIDVDGYKGGTAWEDAEPPRPNPEVAPVAKISDKPTEAPAAPLPRTNTEGKQECEKAADNEKRDP